MTDAFEELDEEERRLRELLDGVWQRRRDELLGRWAELAEDVARLARAGGHDQEAAARSGAEAHRLAGAVGTLGFSALSAEARGLEQVLQRAVEQAPEQDELARVVRTTAALGRELLAARERPAS